MSLERKQEEFASREFVLYCDPIISFTIFLHFFPGRSVNVYIPKFTVYGTYDLKDMLYKMGIVDLFTDKADLSGITGQPQHRVSQVSGTDFGFMGPYLHHFLYNYSCCTACVKRLCFTGGGSCWYTEYFTHVTYQCN